MLQSVFKIDYYFFRLINQQWNHPYADTLMILLRNQYFWSPLYIFLISYIILHHRKNAVKIIGLALFTFMITDLVSTQLLKAYIERPRPCWDWSAPTIARLLIPCSNSFSFVSSHAANHFGISTFLFLAFRKTTGKSHKLLFLWAFLVCYAQIYVGAHYPTDVLGGALLGTICGILVARLFKPYKEASLISNDI